MIETCGSGNRCNRRDANEKVNHATARSKPPQPGPPHSAHSCPDAHAHAPGPRANRHRIDPSWGWSGGRHGLHTKRENRALARIIVIAAAQLSTEQARMREERPPAGRPIEPGEPHAVLASAANGQPEDR